MAPSPQNGNGNGKSNGAQVILTALALIFSVLFSCATAFWQLANPRDDIKGVETRLMSEIFAVESRVNHQIAEIKAEIKDVKGESKEYTREATASVTPRFESIQQQLAELRKQVADYLTSIAKTSK